MISIITSANSCALSRISNSNYILSPCSINIHPCQIGEEQTPTYEAITGVCDINRKLLWVEVLTKQIDLTI